MLINKDSRDMKQKYEKKVEKNPIAGSEFTKNNLVNLGRDLEMRPVTC